MPALIIGGNAAGMTLFVIAVLRTVNWWRDRRTASWQWRRGSILWMAYFGLQLLGGTVVERLRRLETQLGSQVGAVVFACDVGHAGPKGGA